MKAQKRLTKADSWRYGAKGSHGVSFSSGVRAARGRVGTRQITEEKWALRRGEEVPICGGSLAVLEARLAEVV